MDHYYLDGVIWLDAYSQLFAPAMAHHLGVPAVRGAAADHGLADNLCAF